VLDVAYGCRQTRELQTATSQVFGFLVCDVVTSLASLVVAFYYSWKLTLGLLATLPVSVLVVSLITRGLEPAIKAQKRDLARASKQATSSFSAIDIVKVFNGYDSEVWQYYQAIRSSMRNYLRQARRESMQIGYVIFWVILLFVVGFWYGIVLVQQGLQPGAVLTTFYATLAAFQGIEALMPQWLVLIKGISAGHELRELVDGHGTKSFERVFRPDNCVGEVEVRDVSLPSPYRRR